MRIFVLLLFLLSVTADTHSAIGPSYDYWRTADYSGRNALYCYLRFKGINCSYEQVQGADIFDGSGESVFNLCELSKQQGVLLKPVRLQFSELVKVAKPIIVHIDGLSLDNGSFFLVIGATDGQLLYMEGHTGTIRKISSEDFIRRWSGVALIPESRAMTNLGMASLAFIGALFLSRRIQHRCFNKKRLLGTNRDSNPSPA
jgi:ABC-type bacteriocin/lantibiotic exporter with double-glycine peptidase domain